MFLPAAAADAIADSGAAQLPPRSRFSALRPDYIRAQFAGSQGMASLGLGKSFLHGAVEPDIDYGYVPAWAGGVDIHMLSHSTTVALFPIDFAGTWRAHPLVAGYSVLIGLGNDYFLYRRRYLGYYWPSALHFRLFAGTKLTIKNGSIPFASGLAATAQVGAIDSDMQADFENRDIGLDEILTFAFALNLYL